MQYFSLYNLKPKNKKVKYYYLYFYYKLFNILKYFYLYKIISNLYYKINYYDHFIFIFNII